MSTADASQQLRRTRKPREILSAPEPTTPAASPGGLRAIAAHTALGPTTASMLPQSVNPASQASRPKAITAASAGHCCVVCKVPKGAARRAREAEHCDGVLVVVTGVTRSGKAWHHEHAESRVRHGPLVRAPGDGRRHRTCLRTPRRARMGACGTCITDAFNCSRTRTYCAAQHGATTRLAAGGGPRDGRRGPGRLSPPGRGVAARRELERPPAGAR